MRTRKQFSSSIYFLIGVSVFFIFFIILASSFPLKSYASMQYLQSIHFENFGGVRSMTINKATNKMYVLTGYDTVQVINLNDNSTIASIPLHGPVLGESTSSIAFNQVTNTIYVGTAGAQHLISIDGNTYAIIQSTTTNPVGTQGDSYLVINSNNNTIYYRLGGTVFVVDGNSNQILTTITSSSAASVPSMALNANTNALYLGAWNSGRIGVVDTISNTITTEIPVSQTPSVLVLNPNTNLLYSNSWLADELNIINMSTNSVVKTTNVGFYSAGMDINTSTNRIYISDFQTYTNSNAVIAVVDGAINDPIEFADPHTSSPWNVVVNSATGLIYVRDATSGNLNVFNDIVDSIPPVTNLTQNPQQDVNGWNFTDVNVTLNATDNNGGSGVKEIHYTINGGVEQVISGNSTSFTISNEGTNTITYWSVDIAGNVEQTNTYTLKIDKTPPTIIINSPIDGNSYILNQPITAVWSTTDNLSGVASSTGTVPSGQNIDTGTVGAHSFMVSAADKAGNTATKTVIYYVHYNFGGFLPPLGDNKVFKTGGTIPIKFQLTNYNGNIISNATVYLYVAKITDGIVGTDEATTSTSNADTGNQFRYDSTNNIYIYNLSTQNPPLGSPGTYQLKATLSDGSFYTSTISLK